MGKKIYAASRTKHVLIWQKLRAKGINIISTWIDEAGAGESNDLSNLIHRCIAEATECDGLILYVEQNDILKCALIEVGAALAANKLVVLVGNCASTNSQTFYAHKNVWLSNSIEEAVRFIEEDGKQIKSTP